MSLGGLGPLCPIWRQVKPGRLAAKFQAELFQALYAPAVAETREQPISEPRPAGNRTPRELAAVAGHSCGLAQPPGHVKCNLDGLLERAA